MNGWLDSPCLVRLDFTNCSGCEALIYRSTLPYLFRDSKFECMTIPQSLCGDSYPPTQDPPPSNFVWAVESSLGWSCVVWSGPWSNIFLTVAFLPSVVTLLPPGTGPTWQRQRDVVVASRSRWRWREWGLEITWGNVHWGDLQTWSMTGEVNL